MNLQNMCIIFGTLIFLETTPSVRIYLLTNASFKRHKMAIHVITEKLILIELMHDIHKNKCLYILKAFGGIKCLWSSQTLQRVTLCPGNKGEMEVRAKKKNCESIAHEQNCTKPEKFKYHCVMNALGSALIEVCAPEYRIHGMCLYNHKEKLKYRYTLYIIFQL